MKAVDRYGSAFLRIIIRRMKELGITQTALAQRMKASRPYVVKALHGEVNITFSTAARFAKALQMDFIPTLTPKKKRGKTAPAEDGKRGLTCFPTGEIATAAM